MSLLNSRITLVGGPQGPVGPAGASPAGYSLADFGAVGDDVNDDGPAFSAIITEMLESDTPAGVIFGLGPTHRYRIATPVNPGSTPTIRMLRLAMNGSSIRTAVNGLRAFQFSNIRQVEIEDAVFVGTSGGPYPSRTLSLLGASHAAIRGCFFDGTHTTAGAANGVVGIESAHLTVEQTRFGACGGHTNTPVINVMASSLTMRDVAFSDFGIEFSTGAGAAYAWVGVTTATAGIDAWTQRRIVLDGVAFDEGATWGLHVKPTNATRLRAVNLRNVSSNVQNNTSNLSGAVYVEDTDFVTVDSLWGGYSISDNHLIQLADVGTAHLRDLTFGEGANKVSADAACEFVRLEDYAAGVDLTGFAPNAYQRVLRGVVVAEGFPT